MVANWVPVATAGIAAVAGFGGAWLTGRFALAREREARHQQRKAEAYVELLAWMIRLSNEASRAFGAETESKRRLPTPDPAESARMAALVNAYASDQINDLYPPWRKAVDEMADSEDPLGRFRAFNRSRSAREATVAQIRHELETATEPQRRGRLPGTS